MRDYFASLGDSAHPDSSDPRARAITRFQELLLVSFREFSVITDETIQSERKRFRGEITHNIESFAKRGAIRGVKNLGRFDREQAGLIYDALYKAMCTAPPPPAAAPAPSLFTTADGQEEKVETRIELKTFRHFLCEIASWARDEKIVSNGFQVCGLSLSLSPCTDKKLSNASIGRSRIMNSSTASSTSGTLPVEERFRFKYVLLSISAVVGVLIPFQDLVSGLDGVMFNDLMENIEWFFNLHDKNKDGFLTKDEVLTLSESFLVCTFLMVASAADRLPSSFSGLKSAMPTLAPSVAL